MKTRLPIHKNLLELLLTETKNRFLSKGQNFLAILYSCLFLTAYYGLFRVGELTSGSHPVKVEDVHVARNKDKFLFILRLSKTHGKYSHPQSVKISRRKKTSEIKRNNPNCPYKLLREYVDVRPKYEIVGKAFFIFGDRSPVKPTNMRETLRTILRNMNMNEHLYDTHSFRAGLAGDLQKMQFSVETIKKLGRWKSNIVFTYLK